MRIALPRTAPGCLSLLCLFSAAATAQQVSIVRADYNYLSALGPDADPSQAEAAALRLLQMPRPGSVPDGDWAVITAKAHKGLGWVYTTRRALPDAETEFEAALKLNPRDAEVSYWLGSAIKTRLQLSGVRADVKAAHADQAKAEIGRALYHLARASVYDQEGCLDPQRRTSLLEFCRRMFRNYGGKDDGGFERLLEIVRGDPYPPAGFTIAALASKK
jgi:tetratricopeptide (TPR) repeat protein